jgi:hypothetical protein
MSEFKREKKTVPTTLKTGAGTREISEYVNIL